MFRTYAPFLVLPTPEALGHLRGRLRAAAQQAHRHIAAAASDFDIAHLQFRFEGTTLAVSSRVRGDGLVAIELGMGNPHLPKMTITETELRAAMRAALIRGRARQP